MLLSLINKIHQIKKEQKEYFVPLFVASIAFLIISLVFVVANTCDCGAIVLQEKKDFYSNLLQTIGIIHLILIPNLFVFYLVYIKTAYQQTGSFLYPFTVCPFSPIKNIILFRDIRDSFFIICVSSSVIVIFYLFLLIGYIAYKIFTFINKMIGFIFSKVYKIQEPSFLQMIKGRTVEQVRIVEINPFSFRGTDSFFYSVVTDEDSIAKAITFKFRDNEVSSPPGTLISNETDITTNFKDFCETYCYKVGKEHELKYVLLKLTFNDRHERRVLGMQNPSTGGYHFEWIPVTVATIEEAIKFRNKSSLIPVQTT